MPLFVIARMSKVKVFKIEKEYVYVNEIRTVCADAKELSM